MTRNRDAMPHDADAERALLGAMLLDAASGQPKHRNEMLSVIAPEDFWVESNRMIFRAWRSTGGDSVVIARALNEAGEYDAAGGGKNLAEISSSMPTVSNWRTYAEIVRRDSKRRDSINACTAAISKLRDAHCDPTEVGGHLLREIAATIGDNRGATRWDKRTTNSKVLEFAESRAAIVAGGGTTSMPCGIRGASGITLGEAIPLYPGQLTELGGSGGSGKTTAAMQLLMGGAAAGKRVSFISVELKQMIAAMRAVCRAADISERRLLDGKMSGPDFARMYDHFVKSEKWAMFIDRPKSGHWPLVERAIRAAAAGDGAEFIAVDHLHRCRWPEVSRDRRGQFIAMSQSAADLAAELNVGILLLVQLTKIPDGEVPTENHVKEASDIVEAADWLTLIHRPGLGDPTTDNKIDFRDGKARFDRRISSRRFGWRDGGVCDFTEVLR